jgi:hypothetical protein
MVKEREGNNRATRCEKNIGILFFGKKNEINKMYDKHTITINK